MRFVALCLAVFVAACATTQAADPPASSPPPAAGPASTVPSEVATGDLEEALVKLQRVHFGLDSSVLQPDAQKALGDAGMILAKHPDVAIYVEGNSDERGTPEYNVALSEKRARTVVDYLARLGIAENRLTIIPKGETDPLATGGDTQAYAANRRVDFRLQKGGVRLVLENGVQYDDAGKRISKN